MRGRQLGSNTGRGELWGTECRHREASTSRGKVDTTLGQDILRQFIVILIYSRYTKHARRSNSNFTIDIRDWTVTDSVGINLNYSGSIFVFWCPSLVPWVAPAHWPVSICCWRLSRPRPPETTIEICDAAVNSEQREQPLELWHRTQNIANTARREREETIDQQTWFKFVLQKVWAGSQTQRKKSEWGSLKYQLSDTKCLSFRLGKSSKHLMLWST